MKNILSIGSSKIRLTPTELNDIKGGSGSCACCICNPNQAATGQGGTVAATRGSNTSLETLI
ncbi:MAG: hypothetical protein LBK94_05570 [Prevotellaceae bacterium]|jgi:hypothetical protein|nr:hypothetical protein [Prevotellaceae bacterium]